MRKMKRFADGGSDKYKAKYDRKVADIESDYEKAKARKTGRAAEVAKAKYEQRMADAKDDLAKWTGADRSQTRAAEKAAERNLTMTRRFGSAEPKFEDKPLGQARPSDAELTKLTSDASQKFTDSGSFKAAFAAARKDPSKPKTFTWRGTSYTTELASEKPRTAARSTGTATSGRGASPVAGRGASPAAGSGTPPAAGRGNPPAAGRGNPPAAGRGNPPAAGRGNPPAAGRGNPPASAPKPTPTQSELYRKFAADRAAEAKREAEEEKATGSAGARARFKNLFGFGSSAAERQSKAYTRMADTSGKMEQAARWRDVEAQGKKDAAAYASAKKHADIIAAGEKPGASGWEKSQAKFYRENPNAMKKGGKVAKKAAPTKKYAKGGKIDGCAVRGMTKAKRAR